MSLNYLDASALAKRYLTERGTKWIQALTDPLAGNTILIAEITQVEIGAALAARYRASSGITQQERNQAVSLLLHHCTTEYMLIPLSTATIDRALSLTQNHRLRGYDAVQLATAPVVNAQYISAGLVPLIFITADTDLIVAAQAEGLNTDNPNHY
jgi:uncharacterized protein